MDRASNGALGAVLQDLQIIFGDRLESVVAYGIGAAPARSLALLRSLTPDDLAACARRAGAWHRDDAATPLLLTRGEFAQSLDAFPIEYGEIIDAHAVVFGPDPFAGMTIEADDLRRACEVQVKSHLLHLRENYVDCGAAPDGVRELVVQSAPAFGTLLRRLARLEHPDVPTPGALGAFAATRIGLDARVVDDVLALAANADAPVDATRLFPGYVTTMERLAAFVDGWTAA